MLNAFRYQRFIALVLIYASIEPDVLNAFRHQRFIAFLNHNAKRSASSAQRLSASEVYRLVAWLHPIAFANCAQRLSASEVYRPKNRAMSAIHLISAQRLSASEVYRPL